MRAVFRRFLGFWSAINPERKPLSLGPRHEQIRAASGSQEVKFSSHSYRLLFYCVLEFDVLTSLFSYRQVHGQEATEWVPFILFVLTFYLKIMFWCVTLKLKLLFRNVFFCFRLFTNNDLFVQKYEDFLLFYFYFYNWCDFTDWGDPLEVLAFVRHCVCVTLYWKLRSPCNLSEWQMLDATYYWYVWTREPPC